METNYNETEATIILHLERFPDEVLLKILSFLDLADVLKCAQTSKRIRSICQDESLWQNLNLTEKLVPTSFLEKAIVNGCKFLNLGDAEVIGDLKLENNSKLKYLNLLGGYSENNAFDEILKSCHQLKNISIDHRISFESLKMITSQNGQTLQVFDCWIRKMKLPTIQNIVKNCLELREITIFGKKDCDIECRLPQDAMEYFVNNLTSKIEKIDLGYQSNLDDMYFKTLVSRCTQLTELCLAHTQITNKSVTYIIKHLNSTLEKLGLTCCIQIDYTALFELKSMPRLKVLSFRHLKRNSRQVNELRMQLPNIKVNNTNEDLIIARSWHWDYKVTELFENSEHRFPDPDLNQDEVHYHGFF